MEFVNWQLTTSNSWANHLRWIFSMIRLKPVFFHEAVRADLQINLNCWTDPTRELISEPNLVWRNFIYFNKKCWIIYISGLMSPSLNRFFKMNYSKEPIRDFPWLEVVFVSYSVPLFHGKRTPCSFWTRERGGSVKRDNSFEIKTMYWELHVDIRCCWHFFIL